MTKNLAGQKLTVFAFNATTNLPKTGDAANITAYVSKDDGSVTALTDTSATEASSTNAAGYYTFDLSQAETNGDKLLFTAKSTTADIVVIAVPAVVYTTPANFAAASISSGGIVQADVQTIKAQTVAASGTVTFPAATLASTTNITGGTITTATNLTNLPPIPGNWITAAGIAASALNGKGDWLLSSGYTAPPTSSTIAAAVWDLATSGHTTSGSFGAAMASAGSSGDPWSAALPGSYASGTAGYIVGNQLDAAVSTRSTYAGGDTSGTTTLLSRVTGAVALAGTAPSWYVDVTATGAVTGSPTTTVIPLTSLTGPITTASYLVITSGTLKGQGRPITGVSGNTATVSPAFASAPTAGTQVRIVGYHD